MTELNFLSKRRFLQTAGTTGDAVMLKGCALTPPSDTPKAQALSLSPSEMPETTQIEPG